MAEENNERTIRVAIRLQDEMYEKLRKVAGYMGMSPSTIAAVAVAEYCNKKIGEAEYLSVLANKTVEGQKQSFEAMMGDPAKYQQMFKMVAGLVGVEPIQNKDE